MKFYVKMGVSKNGKDILEIKELTPSHVKRLRVKGHDELANELDEKLKGYESFVRIDDNLVSNFKTINREFYEQVKNGCQNNIALCKQIDEDSR